MEGRGVYASRWWASVLVCVVALAAAAREPLPPARPAPTEVSPTLLEAVHDGLAFLARTQNRDGSWNGGDYTVAVSALAGLAFVGAGHSPATGRYASELRAVLRFLLRSQRTSGLIVLGGDPRPMYGHGFGLLLLAQCYGTSGDAVLEVRMQRAIRRGIGVIERAQSADGGWYYTPDSGDDEGSVTVTQIQALRAARNAGFRVDREVIDAAVDYIRRSQDPDGGVRYTVRSGRSSLALTAAGMVVLQGAGEYDSPELLRALGYVRSHLEISPRQPHYHYTHFYAAQALFQQGGADWRDYFPRIRTQLLAQRATDGSWGSSYGRAYGTALALLVLELPLRYLPIYTR